MSGHPGDWSGKKGQIANFKNTNKEVSIRCSLRSENWWCLLFCYAMSDTCSNMNLNYKHYHMVSLTCIQSSEMLYKSAIFFYISS